MHILRFLLCGLLAVMVAISFAPESHAHGAQHGGVAAALSAGEACSQVQAATDHNSGHEHAPGAPCEDCCHSSHCHMKAAPPSLAAVLSFDWSSAKLGFGAAPRFADAPEAREPDPERT
jgi:hypothetical protein